MPMAPPDPPPPPTSHSCHNTPDKSFGNTYPVAFKEPCGLTFAKCCALAYDHSHTAAFHLSPSGCCTLLNVPGADHASLQSQTITPTLDGQTTNPVVAMAGARQSLV